MERRKKRIVKLTAFLFLLAASIFVMPQKAFADENEDITLPTGDIKPMEPQQDESGIDTYGADEGDEFSGTEYELYTVLENRVKEAMLAGNEWVSIKDLKIRRDTYDIWESKHIKQRESPMVEWKRSTMGDFNGCSSCSPPHFVLT